MIFLINDVVFLNKNFDLQDLSGKFVYDFFKIFFYMVLSQKSIDTNPIFS